MHNHNGFKRTIYTSPATSPGSPSTRAPRGICENAALFKRTNGAAAVGVAVVGVAVVGVTNGDSAGAALVPSVHSHVARECSTLRGQAGTVAATGVPMASSITVGIRSTASKNPARLPLSVQSYMGVSRSLPTILIQSRFQKCVHRQHERVDTCKISF